MNLPFDLDERVEDAFVSYLANTVGVTTRMNFYAAFTSDVIKYPSGVVMFDHSEKMSDGAAWSVPRKLSGTIAVICETTPEVDGTGRVVTSVRDLSRNYRAAVIQALSVKDDDAGPADLATQVQANASDMPKGLAAYLVYQKIPGVWIQYAQVGDVSRQVDADKKCLVSLISVSVIAMPVQIGGY